MESIKKMNLSAIEDRLSVSEMQEIQAGSGGGGNCIAGWCCVFGGMISSEFGVGCFAIVAGFATVSANCR